MFATHFDLGILVRIKACAALFAALFFIGCGDAETPETTVVEEAQVVEVAIPQPLSLRPRVSQMLDGWVEYKDWADRMDALLKTEDGAEVLLLSEELLELSQALESSEFPADADKPSVRSRIRVVRTFLLKLKEDFHYQLNYRESQVLAAEAYNALREQFNRLDAMNIDPTIFDK